MARSIFNADKTVVPGSGSSSSGLEQFNYSGTLQANSTMIISLPSTRKVYGFRAISEVNGYYEAGKIDLTPPTIFSDAVYQANYVDGTTDDVNSTPTISILKIPASTGESNVNVEVSSTNSFPVYILVFSY
jgi:hypothetical protein